MQFRNLSLLTALALSITCGGCNRSSDPGKPKTGNSGAFGFAINEDGDVSSLNGKNQAKKYEAGLKNTINTHLKAAGSTWTAKAVIAPAMRYLPPPERSNEDGFYWDWAEVTIELIGENSEPCIKDGGKIITGLEAIRSHLKGFIVKVIGPKVDEGRLSINVVASKPPQSIPTSASVAAALPANQEVSYIIQAGDTLARISFAFYGDHSLWQRILDANPGLEKNGMKPGTSITIPALKK